MTYPNGLVYRNANSASSLPQPGDLQIDLNTYTLFLADGSGTLIPVGSGGNSTYGNTQVQAFLNSGTFNANFIPQGNAVHSLGSSTNQWKDLWLSGNTLYLSQIPLSVVGSALRWNGNTVATVDPTGNILGNLIGGSVQANVFVFGNGTPIPNMGYGNSSVALYLNSNVSLPITTTANVTAGYFIGDGSQLTNLPAGNYSNANVFAYLGSGSNAVISVTGNITGGNVSTGGRVLATGNVSGGNLTTSGLVFASGNITGANLVTAGTANVGTLAVQGNATVALNATVTGNATASNLLSTGIVNATGNVSGGNLTTAGAVVATGNVTGGNLTTAGIVAATGNVTANSVFAALNVTATANVNAPVVNTANIVGNTVTVTATGGNGAISFNTNGTGNIILNSTYINGLLNPVQAQDAATKAYVDGVATGLQVKAASNVATTTGLPAYVYNNGTAGVGATLTGTVNGALVIDTISVAANDRVLVKNETSGNAAYNGIYVVTRPGNVSTTYQLTRSTDNDVAADMYAAYTFVDFGNVNAYTSWTCTATSTNPITIGLSAIDWVQFSGAAEYSAGNGLTLTGTVFSVNTDNNTTAISAGNVIVKAGANLVTPNIGAAVGNSLTLVGTGNISGGNLIMSGTGAITGNVSAGNISTAGVVTATGNITGGNLITAGVMTAAGNATAGNLTTAGRLFVGNTSTLSGNVSALGQLFVGPTANTTTFTGPVIFAQGASNSFSQIGLVNSNGNASADLISYANNGTDSTGYADIGMTGNTFNDTNFTITAPNDGYFFVQGTTGLGGNAVIATGGTGGTTRDIVFATGGFLAANEKLRLVNATSTLQPFANGTFNLGSNTKLFGNVFSANIAVTNTGTFGNLRLTSSNVILGQNAGANSTGVNSISIGAFAGNSQQANSSIIINASGVDLPSTTQGLFVSPVRSTAATANVVYYNSTTKEISYAPNNVQAVPGTVLATGSGSVVVWNSGNNTTAGFKMILRMQYPIGIQMAEILGAEDGTGNVSSTVYGRLNTSNETNATITVNTDGNGNIQVNVNSGASTVNYTYSVTTFAQSA